MANSESGEGMRIGEVLKRSRTRQGIEIAEVEERTKIRTKYLRALESEDWEVLPSPAYARGFLRTYAQVLGLDDDAVIDEFRRQVESGSPEGQAYGVAEPLLEGRRRPLGSEPSRRGTGALVAIGLVGALIVLGVVGLVGGGGDGEQEKAAKGERAQRRHQHQQQGQQPAPTPEPENVTLRLALNADVQVCLIGAGEQPLIDDQVLPAGSEEGPYEAPSFDLRFPVGYDREQFDLYLGGKRTRVPETQGSTAFRITPPARVRQVEPTTACP